MWLSTGFLEGDTEMDVIRDYSECGECSIMRDELGGDRQE